MLCWFGAIQKDRVSCQCKACVQIQFPVVIHKDARVKLERLILLTDCNAIAVFYVSVEFVFSCRLVTYSYGYHLCTTHKIVQIKSPIRSLYHIWGSKAICQTDPRCRRILFSFINTSFVTPVTQVIYRCGPADIIAQTEIQSVEDIMRTVNVHTVSYNMWFCIRNIFPAWHVWIYSLFCFHIFPPISHFQFHNSDFVTQNL